MVKIIKRAEPTAQEIKAGIARAIMEHLIEAHLDPDAPELYLYADKKSNGPGNVLSFIIGDRCKEVTLREAYDRIKELVNKDYNKFEKVVVYTCRDNAMIHINTEDYIGAGQDAFNESQKIWVHGGITSMEDKLFMAFD